jgi:hypothetical protein
MNANRRHLVRQFDHLGGGYQIFLRLTTAHRTRSAVGPIISHGHAALSFAARQRQRIACSSCPDH